MILVKSVPPPYTVILVAAERTTILWLIYLAVPVDDVQIIIHGFVKGCCRH